MTEPRCGCTCILSSAPITAMAICPVHAHLKGTDRREAIKAHDVPVAQRVLRQKMT